MLEYLWRPRAQRTRRRSILSVELLEDRCVPTVALAEFAVPTASSAPYAITTGPDGNLWFTENQANQIGMINPTTHAISEFAIPTASSGPMGITAGPDGNLWFTEYAANQIGEINPTTHVVQEFTIPTASSGPVNIVAGPDGNLWFTEFGANQIGAINPSTHAVTEYPLPTSGSAPMGIAAGPDGNIWFTESSGNNVGTINPTQHTITEYPIPQSGSQPYDVTTGPNGNMWFTESASNIVEEINTASHAFSSFPAKTSGSGPYGIAAGADGNVWFAENSANQIGEVNVATGTVNEFVPPTASAAPTEMTAGPGGTLWFTEASANQIGEVVETPQVAIDPANQTVTAGQTATLTSTAVGFPTPSVQWDVSTNAGVSYTALTNGGDYSGVTTDTLTIADTTSAMSGYRYAAVFTNGVSPTPTVTSMAATLTVSSVLSITPAAPHGTVGIALNETLSVVGSTTPFTVLSVNNFSAGNTGLSLGDITTNLNNGTIVVSGTPTGTGSATFTVTAADTGGFSLTQNLTITVGTPLSITASSMPLATAGAPYSQSITVTGGATPYTTFTVTNFNGGSTGLTASDVAAQASTGVFQISGTPSSGGTVTFTVDVTDSAGTVLTKNFTIAVNPALAITPSLPSGTSGTVYDHVLTVTGGGVPYSSVTVANFNGGTTGLTSGAVSASAAAGTVTIDGTPTAAGTVSFTVHVVDSIGAALSKTYTVTIAPGLTMTASLPAGTAHTSYAHTITVSGGATPYASLAVTGFSAGTTGLSAAALTVHAASGTVVVDGTPTAAGTLTFTVNVTDAAGSHLSHPFTVTVNAPLTVGNVSAQWTAGVGTVSAASTIAGGTAPFSIAASTGLPPGLTPIISGNTIRVSGVPATAGTYAGSVSIHDAAGATAVASFHVVIDAAPAIGNLTVTRWTVGSGGFTGAMTVSGGTGSLTIAGSSGLPTGMGAVLAGNTIRLMGTPYVAGTYDGSVTIHDALGAAVTRTFVLTIDPLPTLGTLNVTHWTVGQSGFTGMLTLAGGTQPYAISSTSGLPTGLTAIISGYSVRFTGAPTVAGTFAGDVAIHDAAGASVTRAFTITINPPVVITTTTLPATRMAELYAASVQAHGGTGTLSYAITAGSLPPGIRLSANGVISGVSRGIGTFTFTVTATDAVGARFSETYRLVLAL